MPAVRTDRFRKVLVATDLTEGGRRALRRASLLPLTEDAEVTLLHVLPPRILHTGAPIEDYLRSAFRREADLAQEAFKDRARVIGRLLEGEPVVEIGGEALSNKDELILLGSGRGSGTQPTGLLSVRVARNSGLPVLVARVRPAEYRRALAAIALEGDERCVLTQAARLLHGTAAKLAVIHAWRLPFEDVLKLYSSRDEVERYRKTEKQRAGEALEAAIRRYISEERAVRSKIRHGKAWQSIVAEVRARKVDLLAMGVAAQAG